MSLTFFGLGLDFWEGQIVIDSGSAQSVNTAQHRLVVSKLPDVTYLK